MSKPLILMFIAVTCICISVLGEKGTRGKFINPVFRRASDLSFIFCFGMVAMHHENVGFGIGVVALIVYNAVRREGDDLFRKGVRRLVGYVFRRNRES